MSTPTPNAAAASTSDADEPAGIVRLPRSNAITAAVIAVAALAAAVAMLVLASGETAVAATAGTIAASGLALAGRIALQRRS